MYSTGTGIEIAVADTVITCNSTYEHVDAQSYFNTNSSHAYTTTDTFYIHSASKATTSENKVKQCGIAKEGGIFKLINTTLSDSGCEYDFISGGRGGVFSCTSCKLSILRSEFENIQAKEGGVIHIEKEGYLSSDGNIFTRNQAFKQGGVLLVQTDSYFDSHNDHFISNRANESSAIEVQSSLSNYTSSIYNCEFQFNSAITNTLTLLNTHMSIRDSYFDRN